METEVWKEVPSYPDFLASNMGRILKKPFSYPMPKGGIRNMTPQPTYGYVRKASKSASHQYMGAYFRGNGNVKVHQLVCEAFHGVKPYTGAVVIHIDEDATNNAPNNLRWGTQKENLNMPRFIEYCKRRVGELSPTTKAKAKKQEPATVRVFC